MQQELRGEMNFAGQRYYMINRIFLEIGGLWPYNNSIYKRIFRIFTFSILAFSSVSQFIKLHSLSDDLNHFLYNLAYAISTLLYTVKFISYIMCIDEVKELLDRIQHDWNILKDGKEREIIRYNAIIGMRYTIIFFAMTIFLLTGFSLLSYVPSFLDLVRPLNESRTRKLPLLSEYFILDKQKYFHPLLVYELSVIVLGVTAMIATETLFMVYLHHACGLFEVVSYCLKHACDVKVSSMSDSEKYIMIRTKIIRAINIHRRTIEFLEYMRNTFTTSYCLMLLLGMVMITVNMFRLFQIITMMNDWRDLLIAAVFVISQYSYMFFVNYFGQRITDRSIRVFDIAYEALWYIAPVQIQKLFIFILQGTIKGYVLHVNGVLTMSLETVAWIISTTISYFTVIYSVY